MNDCQFGVSSVNLDLDQTPAYSLMRAGLHGENSVNHSVSLELKGRSTVLPGGRDVAERQILPKDKISKSWFVYVCAILPQYNLPSPIDLLSTVNSKEIWKQTVDNQLVHIGLIK